VMWGYDGRLTEDETLLQAAKVYFGIGEPMELIPLIYKTPLDRGLIAGFSTVIGKLAQEGHAAAQEILVDAGRQLGRLAVAALQELGLAEAKGRVGACGGVFSAGQWVLEPMAEEIRRAAPEQTAHPGRLQARGGCRVFGRQAPRLGPSQRGCGTRGELVLEG